MAKDILEKNRQQNSSDNYSSRLEAVLNTVIDGIITINSRGIIQSFNASAERIFGYEPEEVIGQNVKMLMPDPYHTEHDGYLSNYHSTGDKKIIGIGREVEAQRKDGSVFSMELGVNEMDISGEKMFVGTIRDISDRKLAEQALKDNQAKLQAIVENTVDGLITIDEKGLIETFNKACEIIFGYPAEEVIGQNVKVLMPAPYHDEHDGYLKNYHNTGERKIIGTGRQVEGRKKDGSIFPLDLSISEVNVKGRKIFSGIVRDITELQETQKRLAAVLDNTVDGLITIDETGTVEHYNKSCESIFGYKAVEVIGQNVKILMPEPYHNEHDGYLKNYHDTGIKKIIGSGREVEGQRKDGSIFPVDLSVSEVQVQGRKLYSGIVRDISERRAAEEQIQQANAELEEFSYRTSHDLRSPLVSSIRLLEMVDDAIRKGETDRALQSTAFIHDSLQKLEELVKDILQLTQTKNVDERKSVIDFVKILDDALHDFSQMDNFSRLVIERIQLFEGEVKVEKSRFVLIVENLISNAVKYQDLNKKTSFIKISTFNEQHNFVLEVRDNGLGVPKKQQENLFKMFKRFHPRTSFGSGLGLYMMKKSADILGGKITFRDSGDGSVFRLEIPLNN
ncbi:PAS domain-containing sensor histidine kinase [Aliiglaciecola sp. LCG003]|uniref:PAS domain-containing sensor histidine kinase n=1 Tax=Aliiglaciecola sp. LCG003 TaxID=3053655 RepID=UPI002574223F|nr:PAS domain-containing sensor histidine kinase [Aliiglaciecola sp. LCG003]WJG10287.1 PAS domain-containing sensor histidine kinase [Aliiglaciecola sp. LCG003]